MQTKTVKSRQGENALFWLQYCLMNNLYWYDVSQTIVYSVHAAMTLLFHNAQKGPSFKITAWFDPPSNTRQLS